MCVIPYYKMSIGSELKYIKYFFVLSRQLTKVYTLLLLIWNLTLHCGLQAPLTTALKMTSPSPPTRLVFELENLI